ncbi:hypothetical protein H9P43_009166 [Blastocladiella emersonii ATCC 22665]|nr:hypothetical protein H9P43_009166 [Blastocladiella emersonii ATCC 22665]
MDPFQLFYGLSNLVNGELVKTDESTSRTSNIVSFFLLGCIPGALFMALAADILGRKKSIWLGAMFFSAGAMIQALVPASDSISSRVGFVMAGRFVGGLGVGILSMTVPLYIAELAPTSIRGRLTTIQQLMITIGIAFASIVNAIIITVYKSAAKDDNSQWRLALGIQAAPGFLLILILFLLPESPRWLLSKNRDDEAAAQLAKLRQTDVKAAEVQQEFHDIKQSIDAERQIGTASWGELMRPGIRNRLVIGVMLQFFQQWTGINAVMYFSSSLFIAMGFSRNTATTVNVVVQALVNVFGTLPGMYLIERAGRTQLLKWGGIGMATFMWIICIAVNLFQSASAGLTPDAYPASATAYSLIGLGVGIATASNWINNYILSAVWPYISEALLANQYAIFGCTGLAMAAYVHFQVPETKGKSLEEMDEVFGFKSGAAASELKA